MGLLDDPVDDELERKRSIEKFLMEVIYPKLSTQKKQQIDKYIARGKTIMQAFDYCDIKHSSCIR